jgi:hypothetical protein
LDRLDLKHPFSHRLLAYWNERRRTRAAPERSEIDPVAIRGLLGDSFVLSRDPGEGHPFRVAGTRLCALFGRELRGLPFSTIWDAGSAAQIHDLLGVVADEAIGVAAGVSTQTGEGSRCDLELLLLPLAHRGVMGARMLGLLAMRERPFWLGVWPAQPLRLGIIQYLGPQTAPESRRAAPDPPKWQKLTIIDGGRR